MIPNTKYRVPNTIRLITFVLSFLVLVGVSGGGAKAVSFSGRVCYDSGCTLGAGQGPVNFTAQINPAPYTYSNYSATVTRITDGGGFEQQTNPSNGTYSINIDTSNAAQVTWSGPGSVISSSCGGWWSTGGPGSCTINFLYAGGPPATPVPTSVPPTSTPAPTCPALIPVTNGSIGLTTDSVGSIYIVSYDHTVRKYSSNGTFLGQAGIGSAARDLQYFTSPAKIAVDSLDNIYVTDTGNYLVKKFNSSLAYITSWGSPGFGPASGDGQFNRPIGITVDTSDNVYVVDSDNFRIQKFSSSGGFIAKWGSQGSANGQFLSPGDITADNFGNIYVTDVNENSIKKFDTSGNYITRWGSYGTGNGQFSNIYSITTDASGYVYVADAFRHDIQKFSPTGTFLGKFGSNGTGPGQFYQPGAVHVGMSNEILVLDVSRIQNYSCTDPIASPTPISTLTPTPFSSGSWWQVGGAGVMSVGNISSNVPAGFSLVTGSVGVVASKNSILTASGGLSTNNWKLQGTNSIADTFLSKFNFDTVRSRVRTYTKAKESTNQVTGTLENCFWGQPGILNESGINLPCPTPTPSPMPTPKPTPAPLAGAVVRLNFDETSGTSAANSAGGSTGALRGYSTPGWTTTKKVGTGALNFNGIGNYVDISTPGMSSFSVAAWVKTSNGGTVAFLNKWFSLGVSGGNALFGGRNASWGSGGTATSAVVVNDDNWHYLVGTFDGTNSKVYVDGVLGGSIVHSGGLLSDNYYMNVGVYYQPDGSYFTGIIDDVQVYNRALSDSDVNSLYQSSVLGVSTQKLGIFEYIINYIKGFLKI